MGNHIPCGITQCYLPPSRGDFPVFTRPKLVLDLATLKGCKAELTWVVVTAQDSLPARDGIRTHDHELPTSQPLLHRATVNASLKVFEKFSELAKNRVAIMSCSFSVSSLLLHGACLFPVWRAAASRRWFLGAWKSVVSGTVCAQWATPRLYQTLAACRSWGKG